MLVSYVERRLRRGVKPILFRDDNPDAARVVRNAPVGKAQASNAVESSADTNNNSEGMPVQSYATLLNAPATLALKDVTLPEAPDQSFPMFAMPTPVQQEAFGLLEIEPVRLDARSNPAE